MSDKSSKTKECKTCGKQISIYAHSRHVNAHVKREIKKLEDLKPKTCEFCGIEYVGGLSFGLHRSRCPSNPNRYKQEFSEKTRSKISKASKNAVWDKVRREKLSNSMQLAVLNNPDSYSKNNVCGRVKGFLYNGITLKGSWEYKVAIWLDSISVNWTYEEISRKYSWEGKTRNYFPDFYLSDLDLFIEVKGYKTDRDIEKWKSFRNLVVFEEDAINMLPHVDLQEMITKFLHKP